MKERNFLLIHHVSCTHHFLFFFKNVCKKKKILPSLGSIILKGLSESKFRIIGLSCIYQINFTKFFSWKWFHEKKTGELKHYYYYYLAEETAAKLCQLLHSMAWLLFFWGHRFLFSVGLYRYNSVCFLLMWCSV